MATLITDNDIWYLENMAKAINVPIFIYDKNYRVKKSFVSSGLQVPPTSLVKKIVYFLAWEDKGQPDINFYAIKNSGLIGGFAINKLRLILYSPVTSDKLKIGSDTFNQVNAKRFRSQLEVLFFHFKKRKPELLPDQNKKLSDNRIVDSSNSYEIDSLISEYNEKTYQTFLKIQDAVRRNDRSNYTKEFIVLNQLYSVCDMHQWNTINRREWLIEKIGIIVNEAQKGGLDVAASISLKKDILKRINSNTNIGNPVSYLYSFGMLVLERMRPQIENEDYLVKWVNNELIANLTGTIHIDELAEKLNVSRTYLMKDYKENMGHTIKEAFMLMKIDLAKQRLLYSDTSIAELAEYLGFTNYTYFSTVFKKVTGISPKHWQKIRRIVL